MSAMALSAQMGVWPDHIDGEWTVDDLTWHVGMVHGAISIPGKMKS